MADLEAEPSEDPTPRNHEVIYDIKAVASDAWELAKFIGANRDSPEVKRFVAERMPEEARQALRLALAAFKPSAGDASNEKTFKKLLASARDQASHYTEVDHKKMKRTLCALETDMDGQNERNLAPQGQDVQGLLRILRHGSGLAAIPRDDGRRLGVVQDVCRSTE